MYFENQDVLEVLLPVRKTMQDIETETQQWSNNNVKVHCSHALKFLQLTKTNAEYKNTYMKLCFAKNKNYNYNF